MILDIKKPFVELGHQPKGQADYIYQDGVIFGWSESNTQYEQAWWLNDDGTPAGTSPIALAVQADRPFDPAWLDVLVP